MRACVDTTAFADDSAAILRAIDDQAVSLIPFAGTVLEAASRFADEFSEESRDISHVGGRDATLLGRLLLRLYEEANSNSGGEIAQACLDTWDSLLEARVGIRNIFET